MTNKSYAVNKYDHYVNSMKHSKAVFTFDRIHCLLYPYDNQIKTLDWVSVKSGKVALIVSICHGLDIYTISFII